MHASVTRACHASLMPVIMMMSSSPHFGTQSGKCESTSHAARTRTIIDYPWRALAKGELAATTQAAALTAHHREAAALNVVGLAGSRNALAGSRITTTSIHAAIIITAKHPPHHLRHTVTFS